MTGPLSEKTFQELKALREKLHRNPEISGEERGTAAIIENWIEPYRPGRVIRGLGGHGLAYVFEGAAPGPTVLIRAELDGLPILEEGEAAHRSVNPGVGHQCGHDGHMAMVAGVAPFLAERGPKRGRAVLLFQPAEETGAGSAAVLTDPRFTEIRPDYAFALHNIPGRPLGEVSIRTGTFTRASRGMVVDLKGRTAHAAHPEDGLSPANAMCRLIDAFSNWNKTGIADSRMVTVVHAQLGKVAFGTAPGEACVMATLRTETDEAMEVLAADAADQARALAYADGLSCEIGWRDVFAATVNHERAVALILQAAASLGIPVRKMDQSFRWSEDFGRFCQNRRGAMFGLGSGEATPPLHAPDYDFPNRLIPIGTKIFRQLLTQILYDDQDVPPHTSETRG